MELKTQRTWGLSQEGLKLIACITMLIDHVGAVFFPRMLVLRMIGRIAFPIYCFLLAEGAHYTKNWKKYALRLFIGILLAELPFDLAFDKHFTWESQSVMVTLFFGFLAVELINQTDNDLRKLVIAGVFFFLAEGANTDYGGYGVLLMIFMSQARGRFWLQGLLLALFCWMLDSLKIRVFGYRISIEWFAMLSLLPIALYSGKKRTSNAVVQWSFYLFYPVHLLILWIIWLVRM